MPPPGEKVGESAAEQYCGGCRWGSCWGQMLLPCWPGQACARACAELSIARQGGWVDYSNLLSFPEPELKSMKRFMC